MDQMLFAFAADLHLQPNAWASHPQLSGDAYESWRQIAEWCVENRVPWLVLGGDIYDKRRPDPASVSWFQHYTQRLTSAGVRVGYVQGDHDFHPSVPWPSVSPHTTHLHRRSIDVGGYSLYGIDWTPRDQLSAELLQIPEETVFLVTHQSWQQLQGIGSVEGDVSLIPHASYLLTGDYHVPETKLVARAGRQDDLIGVVSPGSTCMQSINERPNKSFVVVGVKDGDLATERVPLWTRHRAVLNAATAGELDSYLTDDFKNQQLGLASQLPEPIRKPMLWASYRDDIPEALERIKAWAADDFFLFPAPTQSMEVVEVNMEEAPSGSFETLLDAVRRVTDDDRTYHDAIRVLRSEDPEAEFNSMLQEALANVEQP